MNKLTSLTKSWLGFDSIFPNACQRIALSFLANLDVGRNIRYREIVRKIKNHKEKAPSIMEIGSGKVGITSYLKQQVIGVDIAFNDYPSLSYLKEHIYDGSTLEYQDNSYDYVISVDMLEHVPETKRKKIIEEMLRVTKKFMILAFPCSNKSILYEKKLERIYIRSGQPLPKYLREHLQYGLPEEKKIVRIIEQGMALRNQSNYEMKVIPNENLRIWYLHELCKSKGTVFYYSSMVIMKVVLFLMPFLYSAGDCYRKIIFVEKR